MSSNKDPFVGPIYVPDVSTTIPYIKSGALMQVYEILNEYDKSLGGNQDRTNPKIPATTTARISLTNVYVETGTVTNIAIERKPSQRLDHNDSSNGGTIETGETTWSRCGNSTVYWPASATAYNINIDVATPIGARVGGAKWDFRTKFYGEAVKTRIKPYNANGFVTAAGFIYGEQNTIYGPSGSIRFQCGAEAPDYMFGGNKSLQNRYAKIQYQNGWISGTFTCYSSSDEVGRGNIYVSRSYWVWNYMLPTSENYYNYWGMWNDGWPATMSIYNDVLADSRVSLNGIEDTSEIVGVLSSAVELSSQWQISGTLPSDIATIGWQSLYAAPSGWYSAANPYISYSSRPTYIPSHEWPVATGQIWVSSGAFNNITNYRIFLWISTGSSDATGISETSLMYRTAPGALGNDTGSGTWYLYDEIPAPHVRAGTNDSTHRDIEYTVPNLPRQKNVCFWVGTMCERSETCTVTTMSYDYETYLTSGAKDNMAVVAKKRRYNVVS